MIKISIMYPNIKGSKFDVKYYAETHMPMSIKLLSAHPGFKGVWVEEGFAGLEPGSEPAYIAMTHYLFDSVEDFWAAAKPHGAALQEDLSKCTNIESVIQFSRVLISQ